MKVYVDELPNSCWECVFNDKQKGYCDLQETRILRQFTKRDLGCPLESLSDYTKQVRKEVCEEIWKEFEQRLMNKAEDMPIMQVANMINSVLDQIQGEDK